MTKGDRERLRVELAGKAMQGILSGVMCSTEMCNITIEALRRAGMKDEYTFISNRSVQFADALLAELDRTAEDLIKAGGTE